jgi:hypothetical protein
MATRRRSRRKSISGNLTDIQKRIRYLETRPSASRLASKAVSTKNLALRAVDEDVVADNAIVRRSIANAAVGSAEIEVDSITNALIATNAVNTDSIAPNAVTSDELATDSVTTDKIATGAVKTDELGNDSVTNDKLATDSVNADSIAGGSVGNAELAGGISDDKIAGMSASKLIGSITDSQITGVSASKVSGTISDSQIAGVSASKVSGVLADGNIPTLNASKITGVFSDSQIPALTAEKIPSLPASKITSGTFSTAQIPSITNAMLAGGITNGKIDSVNASTIITGTVSINRLPGELLTSISVTNPLTIGGSGRSRTIGIGLTGYALSGHTHSGYAASGRYDTNMAGSHVGHGGHTHFINTSSTKKLKKEISDYSIDLEKLFLLQPKRFKYKNQAKMASKNREWDYGYIAEEALDLGVEEIVGYDEKGEVDSINYGLLSVFVLELVKKQQSEINFLSEEIKRLKETK